MVSRACWVVSGAKSGQSGKLGGQLGKVDGQ